MLFFLTEEPEDHCFFRKCLILHAGWRLALLHDFESWFTEAGANCNADRGQFRDNAFNASTKRIRDIRLGMATMVLQEESVQGPKWLLSTLKGVDVVEETVFQV
ncbi:hypothetical protein ACVINH_002139 [Rhizobium anhuiense]